MARVFVTVHKSDIAFCAAPYVENGGPVKVAYTIEGITPTAIYAKNLYSDNWCYTCITLRADSTSGDVLNTVVLAPTADTTAKTSVARIHSFERQVTIPAGTSYVVLCLEAYSSIADFNVWRNWTPRSMSTMQVRR